MYTCPFYCLLIAIPDFVYYNIMDYYNVDKGTTMENSSLFLNKIADLFASLGLTYISEFEAMLILLAVFFVLLFLLWLVFRKARLWYWKTDIQIDTLKSIDVRLHNVEEKLLQSSTAEVEKAESETSNQDDEEASPENLQVAPEQEGLTAVGKSGRIYTEAELELQIRE